MTGGVSAAQGDEDAVMALVILNERITPDQTAEAQRIAREWMAKHQQW